MEAPSGLRQLFTGRADYEFIGRTKVWAIVSLVLIALSLIGLLVRGVNLSIDFTGGTGFVVTGVTEPVDVDGLRDTLDPLVEGGVTVQVVEDPDTGDGLLITTPALEELGGAQQSEITNTIGADRNVNG